MKTLIAQKIEAIHVLRTFIKITVILAVPALAATWNVDSIARERQWCQHIITVDSLGLTDKVLHCSTYAFPR